MNDQQKNQTGTTHMTPGQKDKTSEVRADEIPRGGSITPPATDPKRDSVQESSEESFPASDPPSHGGSTGGTARDYANK